MKCKDCVCSDVCYYKAFNDVRHVKRRDDVEKVCKSFVNRDAAKVVHGRWIEKQEPIPWCEDDVDVFDICSVCDCASPGKSNYCPNCGAMMDGGKDNG